MSAISVRELRKRYGEVEADDEEAVHLRLAGDPWPASGMLRTVSVEPWTIRMDGRERRDAR